MAQRMMRIVSLVHVASVNLKTTFKTCELYETYANVHSEVLPNHWTFPVQTFTFAATIVTDCILALPKRVVEPASILIEWNNKQCWAKPFREQ